MESDSGLIGWEDRPMAKGWHNAPIDLNSQRQVRYEGEVEKKGGNRQKKEDSHKVWEKERKFGRPLFSLGRLCRSKKKEEGKEEKKKRSTEKLGVHLASYSLDRGLRTSAGNATIYSRQASGPLSIHCRNSNVMEFDPRAARLFLPPYFSSGGLSDPIGRRTSDPSFSDQPYLLSY